MAGNDGPPGDRAGAAPSRPFVRAKRRGLLPCVRSAPACDSDRVRRRPGRRRRDARGRAARRPGRPPGTSVCRARGKLPDRALEESGIDRRRVHATDVVKPFKWEPRGTRRTREAERCRGRRLPALARDGNRPDQPARARVPRGDRGASDPRTLMQGVAPARNVRPFAALTRAIATVHPSPVLRAGDDDCRQAAMRRFVQNLKTVGDELG